MKCFLLKLFCAENFKKNFLTAIFTGVFCVLFLLSGSKSAAQVCTGTSGPPILLETFKNAYSIYPLSGAGAKDSLYGLPLSASVTKYPFSRSYPADQYYTISDSSNHTGSNKQTWSKGDWIVESDHTGDANGFMMVVNSSDLSSNTEIYRKTITGLCPNTVYTFAAFIANVNSTASQTACGANYAYANMEFKILDGISILGKVETGQIPVTTTGKLNWVQYGINLKTGSQTQVDIVLTNLAKGGCGNDIAIDDITFAVCGPKLTISANPSGPTFCVDEKVVMTGNMTGTLYTSPIYQWEKYSVKNPVWTPVAGAVTNVLTINKLALTDSGFYRLRSAESGNTLSTCGIISDTLVIKVIAPPKITVNSPTICKGDPVTLDLKYDNTVSGPPTYKLDNVTTTSTITVSPTADQTYTIEATEKVHSCVSTLTSTVTVKDKPIVNGTDIIMCAGETKTLKATAASTATSFSWNIGTGPVLSSAPTFDVKPTATTIYTLSGSVTYVVAGVSTTCTKSSPVTATVNPLPTVTSSNTGYCPGGSTTMTASGADSYTWLPVTGLDNSTTSIVVAKPTVTTIYKVTGAFASGCSTTVDVTVTVFPKPYVRITPINPSTCLGGSVTLTALDSNAKHPILYTWTPADGTLDFTNRAIVKAKPIADALYNLNISDANNCSGVASVNVTVTTNKITVLPHDPICEGDTAHLKAYGAPSYLWTSSPTFVTSDGAIVFVKPVKDGLYTYDVTGVKPGCNNSAPVTVSLTVNPKPKVLAVADPPQVCLGQTSKLTGSGADILKWNTDITLDNSAGNPVVATPPVGAKFYTVVGESKKCIDSAKVQVVVKDLPMPFVATPDPICLGFTVNLNAVNNASSGLATKFNWNASPDLSTTTGPATVAKPTSVKTIYTVNATDANSCTAKTTVTVIAVNQIVPVISDSIKICIGDKVNLTAGGGTSYLWLNNDARTPSIIVNPVVTTKYKVKIMNSVCQAFDSVKVIIKNPVEPTLYIPNAFTPNEDNLNDNFRVYSNSILTHFKGLIFNRWGEIIYEWSDITDGWDGSIHGTLAQHGVYVYKITAKSECETKIREPRVGTVTLVR